MDPIAEDVHDAAVCVIGNLDADGRLTATNEEIAAMGGWSEELVEQARQALMQLDPVGCGARDVRECLLVQLEVRGETERSGGSFDQRTSCRLATTQAATPVEADRH